MLTVIDIPAIKDLLRIDGIRETLKNLRGYIRDDYARWQEFETSKRLATHVPGGIIELMPISDNRNYTFKYVNGHPGNRHQGKQSVVAIGVLADIESGYPMLLSEMTLLTALRTAATSALVAQFCAKPDSSCLAMIGAGSQAVFQVLALSDALPIDKVFCYDVRTEAMERLRHHLAGFDLPVTPCATIHEAVHQADVITTATARKTHQRLLNTEDIRPGVHINAIGGDCPGKTELDPRILEDGRVIVEYAAQTRVEGELQLLSSDFPVTELWELVQQRTPGRTAASEVTIFDSVGFALEDFSALRYVNDRSKCLDLGYGAELIPEAHGSPDLFDMLAEDLPTGRTRQSSRGSYEQGG